MSKTVSFGTTDTAGSTGKTRTIEIPNLNWKADFAVTVDDAKKGEVTNLTTPLDQKETVIFSISNVPDVYKNTGIDPSHYSQVRSGLSLLCQLNDTLRVTDSDDPSYEVDLPVSAHVVVKVPNSQFITADVVQTLVFRALATMADTDSTVSARLQSLLRGSMIPPSMR